MEDEARKYHCIKSCARSAAVRPDRVQSLMLVTVMRGLLVAEAAGDGSGGVRRRGGAEIAEVHSPVSVVVARERDEGRR